MPFFALEEHFLPAVGSEIGRNAMVTTYDPVQALFSTTATVSVKCGLYQPINLQSSVVLGALRDVR